MARNALKQDVYESIQARFKMRNMEDTVVTLINTVTLNAHVRRYFKKDVKYFELGVNPVSQTFRASLTNITDYRALTSILIIHEDGSSVEIDKLGSVADLINSDNCLPGIGDPSVVTLGSVLQGRSPKKIKSIMVGAVVLPDISDAGYDSWIARLYPDVIAEEVLWRAKDSIGDRSTKAHQQAASSARIYLYGDAPTVMTLE